MFSRRTVFVVGAGASCELGLPPGDALRSKLIEIVDLERDGENFRNPRINRAIIDMCRMGDLANWRDVFSAYLDAASRIRSGLHLAVSIDSFLNTYREDPTMRHVGKLSIAAAILAEEAASALQLAEMDAVRPVDRADLQNSRLTASWYIPLMRLLASETPRDDLMSLFDNVAFIVFNYDRCLEHFLINAIVNYYNVDIAAAIACMGRVEIVHPYGKVGSLPWQPGEVKARFGGDSSDLMAIAAGIQTYTEAAERGIAGRVTSLVRDAETLVFMGFGFQRQNMRLLGVERSNVRQVFATTTGISDADVPLIVDDISTLVGRTNDATRTASEESRHFYRAHIERGRCRDLMDNYWRWLTR